MWRKLFILFVLVMFFPLPAWAGAQDTPPKDVPSIEELFNYLKGTWNGAVDGESKFGDWGHIYVCHESFSSSYSFTFDKILKINPRSAFLRDNKTAQISGHYQYSYATKVDDVLFNGKSADDINFADHCNFNVVGGGKNAQKVIEENVVLWPTGRTTADAKITSQSCSGNDCAGEASGQVLNRSFEFVDDNQIYYISGNNKILLKRSE